MQKSEQLEPGYELVFTVCEFYDGPRQGVANFRGNPHFYNCIFDENRQDYSNLFELTPVSQEVFDLAMEDWAIWERWESAYRKGEVTLESHGSLPQDRARHGELKTILDGLLRTDRETCFIRVGTFAVESTPELPIGAMRPLQVKWDGPTPNHERYGFNSIRRP